MSKRAERSSSSSSNSQPTPKRNRGGMDNEVETDSPLPLKVILDKLNAMESRMEDNFTNLHTEVSTLRCELMQLNGRCQMFNQRDRKIPRECVGHD